MDIGLKLMFSGLAIVLTFMAFVPYIRSILAGSTRPHVFSWFIWGITTVIVFFAQIEAEGGVGAWPMGLSGVVTVGVAVLAFIKRGDISITRTDWFFLTVALASLPFWYVTSDPLWTVVLLTFVDLLGFGPTMRKAYDRPHEESQLFFLSFMLRSVFVILALEQYSVTTVLFPLSIAVACTCLLIIVAYRRRVLLPNAAG
ncbi:hypothetical protein EH243_07405 [Amphritea opalescens]|uniref:Uncharacterized protein n=1 Tax=Amphritea opalescens TaxID=2490544 RepID=A0A430KSW8_9GAMM|nr:hypothetical protein [Amphritea opalescens]RTE66414.1 hypothetical protein EH243_07405 [Amphritea opalescens]